MPVIVLTLSVDSTWEADASYSSEPLTASYESTEEPSAMPSIDLSLAAEIT